MLERGLKIPGELGPFMFDAPVTLLVCRANGLEAWSVAEELRDDAVDAGTPREHFQLKYADDDKLFKDGTNDPVQRRLSQGRRRLSALATRSSTKTALLLYMNENLFRDGGVQTEGSVAFFVYEYLKLRVRCRLARFALPCHAFVFL